MAAEHSGGGIMADVPRTVRLGEARPPHAVHMPAETRRSRPLFVTPAGPARLAVFLGPPLSSSRPPRLGALRAPLRDGLASLDPAPTRKGLAPIGKTDRTRTEAVAKLGYRSSPGSRL